jgi:hypothetical protein
MAFCKSGGILCTTPPVSFMVAVAGMILLYIR